MTDIELKKRSDPKAVIMLLAKLSSALVELKVIEQARTEKFLRELAALPITLFTPQKGEVERMKKASKELCKAFALRRTKEEILQEALEGPRKSKPQVHHTVGAMPDT